MKKKLLVVGQTPPPYHGQAIMIQNTILKEYQSLDIYHSRMNFSKDIDTVGKFKILKIFKLFSLVLDIAYKRFRYGIKNLYYPPAGPSNVAIYRDVIILLMVRWLFSRTIYHFRAGGVSEQIKTYKGWKKKLVDHVYANPDLSIRLSSKNPEDGKYFNCKKDVVIPNGIKDFSITNISSIKEGNCILFVGALKLTKGILVLLQAAKILKEKNINFKIKFMGKFDTAEFKNTCVNYIKENDLTEYIEFLGVKTAQEKWTYYANADVLCFPTFYECETFGNVLIEAMQFKLPVVATFWRGVPDIVLNNETGLLVPIKNHDLLANALLKLLMDDKLRLTMGTKGRERYLNYFTEDKYYTNFENEVNKVCL
ncbi:glycosyltransferase [Flavobacterium sp. ASW18X]|uniref:glycosyltransferase n=1 Tax=Flavobacterium sp. ASW18X TaxID=2572595 RepID=UPI0010AE2CE0|nr:glycosyltransferase [Flavobacterium sp. ASW18X]TKD65093.1 glycosyltransferase [Flavobacterium sp. ASW18X]